MSGDLKERLLACPFCGSVDIDSAFWMRDDEACGPGCSDCGATADTVEAWNMRASGARIAELEARLAEAEKEDDRLRAVCHQMGDRHAAQVVQIKAMSEALEPFANAWRAYGDKPSDDTRLSDNRGAAWLEGTLITFGNLRRAAAALDPKPTATGEAP